MMSHGQSRCAALSGRVVIEPIDSPALPGALLTSLAREDDPALLDSAALHETQGRYTILACRPVDVLTLHDGVLTSRRLGELARRSNRDIWRALREAFECVRAECDEAPPYWPGWIGYVGYEVGRHVERLPGRAERDTPLPDLRLGFYDALAVYDALLGEWSLVRVEFDAPPPGAGAGAEALRGMFDQAVADPTDAAPQRTEQADAAARPLVEGRSPFTPEQYRQAVARCADYIAAGDVFQVNLSQRFTIDVAGDPMDVYRLLRRRNPAWYAAFLSFAAGGESCAILSSSPELFLSVRDGHVVTRPIKGTRRRIGDAEADSRAATDLMACPKDNAELAMIIDLLRNDIGRVCRYASVQVTDPRRLETHPTVFHLVGTVEGDLHEGIGPAELLRATFPGGSITGAPKIRAMEIIDELEPAARGPYTGCIGHVGVNGDCTWNIVIRTVVWHGAKAHVQVGGGIVADSDPQGEYQETLDKARALLEAIAEARSITPAASK